MIEAHKLSETPLILVVLDKNLAEVTSHEDLKYITPEVDEEVAKWLEKRTSREMAYIAIIAYILHNEEGKK